MKIYTKKGDTGETSLFGGDRVLKSSLRIEAYGTVDELNSTLGIALSHSPSEKVASVVRDLQQQLFRLGADLATPKNVNTQTDRIDTSLIEQLESTIDELEEYLPELKNFILPGGSHCGAVIHLARTICRRAERAAVACAKTEPVSKNSIIYLNRLSDLLFVLARYENHQSNLPETVWRERQKR